MAKSKSRTTGLPVPAKRDPAARKFRSRKEREDQVNRLVLIIAGAIAGVIILILAGALIIEEVIAPNKPVAMVNGQAIPTRDFQRRVVFDRWRTGVNLQQFVNQYGQYAQQFLSDTQNPYGQAYSELADTSGFAMGQRVLGDMINDILIRQYADANNIKITDADIDKQIYSAFGYEPNPTTPTPTPTPTLTTTPIVSATPTPSPTVTPAPTQPPQTSTPTASPFPTGIPTVTPGPTARKEQFDKNLQNYYDVALKATNLSQSEVRQIFAAQALSDKVKEQIAGKPQTQQKEIKARHILVDASKETQANQILTALQNGASFANLARADSTDTSNRDKGGELGWAPKGQYVQEFEDAVWSDKVKVGDVVGPIKTQFGFHIIQIEGREVRTLSDTDAATAQDRRFQAWLTKLSSDTTKVQKFDEWYSIVPTKPSIADLGLPAVQQQGANNGLPPGFPGSLPGQ